MTTEPLSPSHPGNTGKNEPASQLSRGSAVRKTIQSLAIMPAVLSLPAELLVWILRTMETFQGLHEEARTLAAFILVLSTPPYWAAMVATGISIYTTPSVASGGRRIAWLSVSLLICLLHACSFLPPPYYNSLPSALLFVIAGPVTVLVWNICRYAVMSRRGCQS